MNTEIKYDRTEQMHRSNTRIEVLGNVTIEAATDAARELTHKLNAQW